MLCNQWNFYITFSIFPFIWHFHNWVWYNLPQYKPINRNLSLYCNIDSNKTSIWLDDCFKIFFIAVSIFVIRSKPLVPSNVKAIHLPYFYRFNSVTVSDYLFPLAYTLEHIGFITKPLGEQFFRTTAIFVFNTRNANLYLQNNDKSLC